MKPRPWLDKVDKVWVQQLYWNVAREIVFIQWHNHHLSHVFAEQCPLIEEAQWFLSVVPKICPVYSNEEIVELFLKNGRTARHLAYAGIITDNLDLIKEAAINGDPAAQFRISEIAMDPNDSNIWLNKSMVGGYNLALRRIADLALASHESQKYRNLLRDGVQASCPSSISAYVDSELTSEQEALYYSGHIWLIFPTNKSLSFFEFVNQQHNIRHDLRDRTSSFIIGQIFNYLIPEEKAKIKSINGNEDFYQTLLTAHDVYNLMITNVREAVFCWILISKRLPIVKDIRTVIAKNIWQSRDQPEWFYR